MRHFDVEDFFVGKTFDDFLLAPQESSVKHRGEIILESRFSRRIKLNLPIAASNMDTVTGSRMCIALAQEGGIGILPRSDFISIACQTNWVREVKRAENFIIENPYTIEENQTVGEARREMKEKKVETLLVVGQKKRLTGVVTFRRIMLCFDDDEPVKKWMASAEGGDLKYSKKNIATLEEARQELLLLNAGKLPLVDENFQIRGLITSRDIANLVRRTWTTKDISGRLRVGAAIGAVGDYLERTEELIKTGADVIVIDMAHAHNRAVTKSAIENFRKKFGDHELVCGNVATFEGACFLAELGVDGIKAGIGPGLGCRTRLETSVGVPQIQAIRAVWRATQKHDIPFISDGGARRSGHIAMALFVGASSVMIGSMLAGTDEAPGEVITDPATGTKCKIYRGMTSPETKLKEGPASSIKHVEGQEQRLPYAGSVKEILNRIKEGLRSAVSYAGETNLEAARQKTCTAFRSCLIPLSMAAQDESFKR